MAKKFRFGREVVRYVRIPIDDVTNQAIEGLRNEYGDLACFGRDANYLTKLLEEAVFAVAAYAEMPGTHVPSLPSFNVAQTSRRFGKTAPEGLAEPRRIKATAEFDAIQAVLAAADSSTAHEGVVP